MNQPLTYSVTLSFLPFADNYTFSAKEKDVETGLSYFGSRYYSSDLSIWLSVDPMSAKYPQESPYVFCGNNPIIFKDPNGREKVISYNTTSGTNSDQTRNKHLTNAANNFAENRGVIHLWAHGMVSGDGKCVGITTYSPQTAEYDIYSTNELDQFLSDNSKIYATNDNQTAILVMHCCKTGQEDALAQKASKDLNLLVVAPSDDITFSTSKYSDGREYSQETGVANGGSWVIYYKGEKMNSFSGKTPPLFDKPEQVIRRYEEEYRQKHPDEALAD